MNEPATMFDIGMMRIRSDNRERWTPELLNKIKGMSLKLDPLGSNMAVYNWDKNKISIGAYFFGKPSEETCTNVLKIYKEIILPHTDPYSKAANESLASPFNHINFSKTTRTDAYYENIASLYEFTIGIYEKSIFEGKIIFCSSSAWAISPQVTKYDLNYK